MTLPSELNSLSDRLLQQIERLQNILSKAQTVSDECRKATTRALRGCLIRKIDEITSTVMREVNDKECEAAPLSSHYKDNKVYVVCHISDDGNNMIFRASALPEGFVESRFQGFQEKHCLSKVTSVENFTTSTEKLRNDIENGRLDRKLSGPVYAHGIMLEYINKKKPIRKTPY